MLNYLSTPKPRIFCSFGGSVSEQVWSALTALCMNICADFFEEVCSVPALTIAVDAGRQLHVYFYVVDRCSK